MHIAPSSDSEILLQKVAAWLQLGTTDFSRETEEVTEPDWLLVNIHFGVSLLFTFHKLKEVTQQVMLSGSLILLKDRQGLSKTDMLI